MDEQMRPRPSITPMGLVVGALALALLAALAFIAYQNLPSSAVPASLSTPKQPTSSAPSMVFEDVLSEVARKLTAGGSSVTEANARLGEYIAALPTAAATTDSARMRAFAAKHDVPFDYAYFFREVLPRFRDSVASSGSAFRDDQIMMSAPPTVRLRARLLINRDLLPVDGLLAAADSGSQTNRVITSAAYTSPFNIPAGLTIVDGSVLNPALQAFEGILIIDDNGKVRLTTTNSVSVEGQDLRIARSHADYVAFLAEAAKRRLSVIQTHLLIDGGRVAVEEATNQRSERRVIFETADHGIHLYDSRGPQSLFEAATFIRNNYGAVTALNLEGGAYRVGRVRMDGKTENRTAVKAGTLISNLLIFDLP